MHHASPFVGVCKRKVREVKILGWFINALKFIMTPAAEVCDESFRITVDLLELIVGCTAGCLGLMWSGKELLKHPLRPWPLGLLHRSRDFR